MSNGILVALEGIEGAGKTTLANDLCDYYRLVRGYDVTKVREPGGTEIAEKVREVLVNRPTSDFDKRANFLLFSAARAEVVSKVIKPALEKGHLVITDRYIASSLAYQGYGTGLDLDEIYSISMFSSQNTIPNLNILLQQRNLEAILARSTKENARDNENLDFYKQVAYGYRRLSRNEDKYGRSGSWNYHLGDWQEIDPLQRKVDVFNQAVEAIDFLY